MLEPKSIEDIVARSAVSVKHDDGTNADIPRLSDMRDKELKFNCEHLDRYESMEAPPISAACEIASNLVFWTGEDVGFCNTPLI